MVKKLDKETLKITRDGQAIKDMTASDGWQLAKRKLVDKISKLLNIENVNVQNADATTIMAVITANKEAAKILMNWIKDVEGDVAQFDGNQSLYQQIEEEIILKNED